MCRRACGHLPFQPDLSILPDATELMSDARGGGHSEPVLATALRSLAALSLVLVSFVLPTGQVAAVVPLMSLFLAGGAFAAAPTPGGIFITGHDSDFHALQGPNVTGARNIITKALGYVTQDKTGLRVLLVTDLHSPGGGYSDPRSARP